MPIDSHLPQADPFSLVPTFNYEKSMTKCPSSANVGPKSKICEILKFFQDRLEWSKKPFNATVPLNVGAFSFLILCITTATARLVS
jgi:hypothetical protein